MEQDSTDATQAGRISVFSRGFLILAILVSLLAAGMTWASVALGLKPWIMYLAWTAFGLGQGGARGGLLAIATMLAGVIIGMLTLLGWALLEPATAGFALPIAVFAAVMVVFYLSLVRGFSGVPACFLGLSTFFASQLPPTVATFLELAAGIALGAVAAGLALVIDRFCRV